VSRHNRRLAAILAADVAGYSRLMSIDEEGTLERFNALRAELIDPKIAQFKGAVRGTAGDSLLVEFSSAVDAVQCAVEAQDGIASRNADLPDDHRIIFRMGLNVGDVIADGGTIYGDAVNVAARLEKLAGPGSVVVGLTTYDQVKGKVPYRFLDLGEHAVKNIAQPVRAFQVGLADRPMAPMPKSEDLPLPSKPSVVVLPFTNMSGEAEQDYFSDGISDDIITELARNTNLFVISRNSSFMFKGRAVDVADIGRKLGVRYAVEGSVRKAGKRIRITAQLIEAATGTHLWAERYDREIEDLFAVQDEVTERVVWALAGQVGIAEIDRSRRAKTERLDSYDLLLRGIEAFNRFTQRDSADSIEYFKEAVNLEPRSARAHAWLAEAYGYASTFEASAEKRALSLDTARTAIQLGDTTGQAEAIIASHCRWNGDFEAAEAHLQRAVKLGPTNPYILSWLGFFRLWQGQAAEARDVGERLTRLDPLDPGWNYELLGCSYYLLGAYDKSLESFRKWRNNEHYRGLANLAACLAQLGRLDEAHAAWEKALKDKPGFTIADYKRGSPYLRASDREHWLQGLRKLGIAE
jgi:TolB-like protein/Tfp pilus assembly protein PilF